MIAGSEMGPCLVETNFVLLFISKAFVCERKMNGIAVFGFGATPVSAYSERIGVGSGSDQIGS